MRRFYLASVAVSLVALCLVTGPASAQRFRSLRTAPKQAPITNFSTRISPTFPAGSLPFNTSSRFSNPFFPNFSTTNVNAAAIARDQFRDTRRFERNLERSFLYNSYLYGSYPYGGAMSNPYTSGYSGGGYSYGQSGYGSAMPSYGSGMPSYGSAAPSYAAPAPSAGGVPTYKASAPATKELPVFAAFGIPEENGDIQWPTAFRLMPPEQKRDLLKKAQAQLLIAGTQAVGGKVNPLMLKEATQSVENLRRWLRSRQTNMAEPTYREGDRFLNKLDDAIETMGKST
jgi:hypothetical protein